MTAVLAHVGVLLAATKSQPKSSGSAGFLILILVVGVGAYFFFLRPQQQKARRQRQQSSEIAVGDEVQTVGGIIGRVLSLDAERVTILSGADADGLVGNAGAMPAEPTRLVLVRNAIARKIEPPVESTIGGPSAEADGHWGGEGTGDADGGAAGGVSGRDEVHEPHEPPEEGTGS